MLARSRPKSNSTAIARHVMDARMDRLVFDLRTRFKEQGVSKMLKRIFADSLRVHFLAWRKSTARYKRLVSLSISCMMQKRWEHRGCPYAEAVCSLGLLQSIFNGWKTRENPIPPAAAHVGRVLPHEEIDSGRRRCPNQLGGEQHAAGTADDATGERPWFKARAGREAGL